MDCVGMLGGTSNSGRTNGDGCFECLKALRVDREGPIRHPTASVRCPVLLVGSVIRGGHDKRFIM